jgi:hypothetical protein
VHGGVGVAGVSLGGGIGLLARSHGWLAQSIRSLDLVSANGELLKVNEDNHPELFWALRGSGGQQLRHPHLAHFPSLPNSRADPGFHPLGLATFR